MIKPEIKADISDSTNSVLKELALPASTQIGQALGNVFGLVNTLTLPAKLANDYAQKNFNKYNDKLNDIPKEKIKQVEPEIAIPIIEKLTYISNEDLADAYANLLANASNVDMVDCIHPGFINKLNNMAPDEVKILELIKNKPEIYYIIFKACNPKNNQYLTLSYCLTGLEQKIGITPAILEIHINNLISLSILEDKKGSFKVDEEGYKVLNDIYQNSKDNYEEKAKNKDYGEHTDVKIEKSYYTLSTLGETFITACTKS